MSVVEQLRTAIAKYTAEKRPLVGFEMGSAFASALRAEVMPDVIEETSAPAIFPAAFDGVPIRVITHFREDVCAPVYMLPKNGGESWGMPIHLPRPVASATGECC